MKKAIFGWRLVTSFQHISTSTSCQTFTLLFVLHTFDLSCFRALPWWYIHFLFPTSEAAMAWLNIAIPKESTPLGIHWNNNRPPDSLSLARTMFGCRGTRDLWCLCESFVCGSFTTYYSHSLSDLLIYFLILRRYKLHKLKPKHLACTLLDRSPKQMKDFSGIHWVNFTWTSP